MNRFWTGKIAQLWAKARRHFWRGIYLLAVVSFFLPFVTVEGCESSEVTDYYGFQLLRRPHGWVFLFPMCLGLVFFGLSFIRRKVSQNLGGFLKASKCIVSSANASITVALLEFFFLFDTVHWRMGRVLNTVCWGLVYAASLVGGLRTYRVVRLAPEPGVAPTKSKGILSLRLFYYLVAVLALVVPLADFALSDYKLTDILWASISLCLYATPGFLLLYFLAEGIKMRERWAVVSGVAILAVVAVVGLGVLCWRLCR